VLLKCDESHLIADFSSVVNLTTIGSQLKRMPFLKIDDEGKFGVKNAHDC
jgi:hypothetical protein